MCRVVGQVLLGGGILELMEATRGEVMVSVLYYFRSSRSAIPATGCALMLLTRLTKLLVGFLIHHLPGSCVVTSLMDHRTVHVCFLSGFGYRAVPVQL